MDRYQLDQLSNLTKKVSELDRKIDFIMKKLNLQYVDSPPPPDYPEVRRLLMKNDLMGAIKVYQMETGAGLGEAKSAVEEIRRSL